MLRGKLRFSNSLIFVAMFVLCGFANAESSGSSVDAVCERIYRGEFDIASGMAKQMVSGSKARSGLTSVIGKYQEINHRRQAAKEAAFQEQMVKLEEFRNPADVNTSDVNTVDVNAVDANVVDANAWDPNDPNGIVSVLAVIARAEEFANPQQKNELLSDPFVIEMMQKSISHAVKYETKGD